MLDLTKWTFERTSKQILFTLKPSNHEDDKSYVYNKSLVCKCVNVSIKNDTHPAFTCSKLTETLGKSEKYVQS